MPDWLDDLFASECTGWDDHDPPPCPKCERMKAAIREKIDLLQESVKRLAWPFAYGEPNFDITKNETEIDCCVNITYKDVQKAREVLGLGPQPEDYDP